MPEDNNHKSIQDNILAAIKAGQVHMKPRWHFVLQTVLFIVGVILVLLASLFIGSFFLFMLHQNGSWFAPAFGSSGIRELFTTLPIIFVLVATAFIIILQILVRHYSFAYGKPTLYTVIIVVLLVVGGSFLIEQSRFHEGLLMEAREHKLPLAGGFYRQFGETENLRLTPGIVVESLPESFQMRDPRQHLVLVVFTPDTQFLTGTGPNIGDRVIVLGDRNGDQIEAEGVRILLPNERFLPPRDED